MYTHTARRYALVRAADSTDSPFPSRVPTLTAPSGAGVVEMSVKGRLARKLKIIPVGTDAADETFDMRVIGWNRASAGLLWIPETLWQGTVTLGATTGVNASEVENEYFLADTIVAAAGYAAEVELSPADDTVAHIVVDTHGAERAEVTFDLTLAAGANALVAMY